MEGLLLMCNKEEPGIQHLACKHTILTEMIKSDCQFPVWKHFHFKQPDLDCARATISILDNSINTFVWKKIFKSMYQDSLGPVLTNTPGHN